MALKILSPIHKAGRQISIFFEERLKDQGLSPLEGHILSYLSSYAPRPIGELVRVFGVKHSTMTSLLDRFEEDDLIRRNVNPDDRRSFVISLTAKGKVRARRAGKMAAALEAAILKEITKKDYAGFQKVIEAIDGVTKVEVRKS